MHYVFDLGYFFICQRVKQEFYLMINKKKTKRSITLIFLHVFTFILMHNI